jgi:hypothetical protein
MTDPDLQFLGRVVREMKAEMRTMRSENARCTTQSLTTSEI